MMATPIKPVTNIAAVCPVAAPRAPYPRYTSREERVLLMMDWIIPMRLTSFIRSYPMKIDLAVLSSDRAMRFREETWISILISG